MPHKTSCYLGLVCEEKMRRPTHCACFIWLLSLCWWMWIVCTELHLTEASFWCHLFGGQIRLIERCSCTVQDGRLSGCLVSYFWVEQTHTSLHTHTDARFKRTYMHTHTLTPTDDPMGRDLFVALQSRGPPTKGWLGDIYHAVTSYPVCVVCVSAGIWGGHKVSLEVTLTESLTK